MKSNLLKLSGVTLAIALSTTNVAHAEGFFSGLFGWFKSDTDFKSLLVHVPADTAYLMANKEPIPEKLMKHQMQRSKDIIAMFRDSDNFKKTSAESEGHNKFFSALFEEYEQLLADDKISETGLSLKASSVFYGYEMMPVLRLGIADKDKMMAMIKRAEEKSSYNVEFTKCGEFDCFESTNPKGNLAVTAVFLEDQLAASIYSVDNKEGLKKHLIGEANPKKSYSVANWDGFLKENDYPGYGDGFIKLKNIFVHAKPLIIEDMKGEMDEKSLNGCLAVADQHLDNMTEIVFGTKELEEKIIAYELLFKTSEVVSTVLQTLANETNIPQRTEDAIFDFGVNIDFTKLRSALTQYSTFLIKSGEENKCPAIKAQDIRKGMGGMAMVMSMGLSQFNSLYASVSDIQLDDKMKPKKVDVVISVGSDDPAGLLAMAGMMAPPLLSLKIPDDGSVVKLPEGLIPSKGGVMPDVFLSQSEKALNIFVGNDKPMLKAQSNEVSEISFSSMDLKGYITTLSSILDALPESEKESDKMPDLEMLKKVGDIGGKMYSTTSADKRGLAVNYRLKF